MIDKTPSTDILLISRQISMRLLQPSVILQNGTKIDHALS